MWPLTCIIPGVIRTLHHQRPDGQITVPPSAVLSVTVCATDAVRPMLMESVLKPMSPPEVIVVPTEWVSVLVIAVRLLVFVSFGVDVAAELTAIPSC